MIARSGWEGSTSDDSDSRLFVPVLISDLDDEDKIPKVEDLSATKEGSIPSERVFRSSPGITVPFMPFSLSISPVRALVRMLCRKLLLLLLLLV